MSAARDFLVRLRSKVRLRTRLRAWKRRTTGPVASRPNAYRTWAKRYDTLRKSDAQGMRRLDEALHARPTFSLILDAQGVTDLARTVRAVLDQEYAEWELLLCMSTDDQTNVDIETSRRVADADPRVELVRYSVRDDGGDALEIGLRRARGDFGVVMDPFVLIRPHALLLVTRALDEHPDAVLLYSDDDRLERGGVRSDHAFKPDWSPALLCSQNYVRGFCAFRLDHARKVGGFRKRFGPDQDWDLYLRLTADTARPVVHIPHVLAHRLARCEWSCSALEVARAALAVTPNLGSAVPVGTIGVRIVHGLPEPAPPVRLVVATAFAHADVEPCITSLLRDTEYAGLSLSLVVDERITEDPTNHMTLERVSRDSRVDVVVYPHREFNYAWVQNWAVSRSDAETLCLVNDDVSVLEPRWLELMVGHLLQDRVGAVGARLLYPDGSVQHGGVILGLTGVAAPYHSGLDGSEPGYLGRAVLDQDLSCVTAGCMLVRREAYLGIGGMDTALAIAFNDVDFCIRLRHAGWRVVYAAGAELCHRESRSVGLPTSPVRRNLFAAEEKLMKARWGQVLTSDPFYNPNLGLAVPGELAFPPRVAYPWR